MFEIPSSYEASRERFREYLSEFKKRYPAPQLESRQIPYPDDHDLTIDILHADATKRKERLFVLSTGLHGIEGYVGAVMMQLFIAEYLPQFDPATTGILLIHAINPWGMKNRRRVNPNNVDLNRNFLADTADLAEFNLAYKQLSPFLNPQKPLNNHLWAQIAFLSGVIANLLKYSVSSIRDTTLMGQYHTPHGVYYGGTETQPETLAVMDILRTHFDGYPQIVHLDMHTGYGPRYEMTIVNSAHEPMNAQQTATKFNYKRVVAADPEEFYTIHGDMMDYVYQITSDKNTYATTFEFGTYGDSLWGAIHSLRTTIFENQVFHHGGSKAAEAWVAREYRELFMPSEEAWLSKALEDAHKAFTGILNAYGYL